MAVTYHHHNTDADVERYVRKAVELAAQFGRTPEMEAVVFTESVRLLAAKVGVGTPDLLHAGAILPNG